MFFGCLKHKHYKASEFCRLPKVYKPQNKGQSEDAITYECLEIHTWTSRV